MKFKTRANSQIEHLGVLRYKEGADSGRKVEIPARWLQGSKEERMGKILQDLPEAAFRSPSQLTETLRSIHQAIYAAHPELREEIVLEFPEGGDQGAKLPGEATTQNDSQTNE